ncbi:hypothetical protein [Mesorhizobium sp. M0590]|uniref:hypothetical protein n=1 Tax=Mesorhizobium sp. M0590 TaxID=2956966 RepID=UPI00333618D2
MLTPLGLLVQTSLGVIDILSADATSSGELGLREMTGTVGFELGGCYELAKGRKAVDFGQQYPHWCAPLQDS